MLNSAVGNDSNNSVLSENLASSQDHTSRYSLCASQKQISLLLFPVQEFSLRTLFSVSCTSSFFFSTVVSCYYPRSGHHYLSPGLLVPPTWLRPLSSHTLVQTKLQTRSFRNSHLITSTQNPLIAPYLTQIKSQRPMSPCTTGPFFGCLPTCLLLFPSSQRPPCCSLTRAGALVFQCLCTACLALTRSATSFGSLVQLIFSIRS